MLVARALIARSRACHRGPFSGLPARWPVAIYRGSYCVFRTGRFSQPGTNWDGKLEAQVVNGIQDLRQHLVCCIKMPQVGARIAAAHLTRTFGVKRPLVSS